MPGTDRFCGRCGLARSEDGKPVDPLIGIVLDGRYRIERRIGVGGMGTVYLAVHTRLGQRVAVKVLHERYAGDVNLTKRFEHEALTYGRVSHPNLVALHDFGRADGTVYMVLEYCPGTSLSVLLRERQQLEPRLATDVITQIAQGLGEAHAEGIVHRDLKPENVVLTETRPGRYHVKLLDFGIAKCIDDDDAPKLTAAGMVFGTPEYMAPEQARGDRVDARTDVYALGTMLYELLTGRPPFTGTNKMQVMHRQASDTPDPLSEKMPAGVQLPVGLEAAVVKCLEKRPADRFQSCASLIAALEAAMGEDRLTPLPLPASDPVTSAGEQGRGPEPRGSTTAASMEGLRSPSEESVVDELIGASTPPPHRATTSAVPLIGAGILFSGVIALAAWLFSAPEVTVHKPRTVASASAHPPTLVPQPAAKPALAPVATQPVVEAPKPTPSKPVVEAPKPTPPKPVVEAPKPVVETPRPVVEAPKPVIEAPKPTVNSKRVLAKARKSLRMGRFDDALAGVKAVLSEIPQHEEALALQDQVNGVMEALTVGRTAFKGHDCVTAVKALGPVLTAAPGTEGVSHMVSSCRDALPPRTL